MDDPTYNAFLNRFTQESDFSAKELFEILSTIRYDPLLTAAPKSPSDITPDNFFLFPEHIERARFTLGFFEKYVNNGKPLDSNAIVDKQLIFDKLVLAIEASGLPIDKPLKIRVLITIEGDVKIELYETPIRAKLFDGLEDNYPEDERYSIYVDPKPALISPFTSFKTTRRKVYNESRARNLPQLEPREEVVLTNTAGEVMEGSVTNIAIRAKLGDWVTPKLTSGCLCGVTRHFLLRKNLIKEGDISKDSLKEGQDVLLMNGIMGCVRGTIKKAP